MLSRSVLGLLMLCLAGCGDDSDPNKGGSGGTSGTPACVPAHRAVTLAMVGDQRCAEQERCIEDSCATEFANAVGAGWESKNYSGGICEEYVSCVETCDCQKDCSLSCRDMHADSGACLDAIIAIAECRNNACPSAADSCVDY